MPIKWNAREPGSGEQKRRVWGATVEGTKGSERATVRTGVFMIFYCTLETMNTCRQPHSPLTTMTRETEALLAGIAPATETTGGDNSSGTVTLGKQMIRWQMTSRGEKAGP